MAATMDTGRQVLVAVTEAVFNELTLAEGNSAEVDELQEQTMATIQQAQMEYEANERRRTTSPDDRLADLKTQARKSLSSARQDGRLSEALQRQQAANGMLALPPYGYGVPAEVAKGDAAFDLGRKSAFHVGMHAEYGPKAPSPVLSSRRSSRSSGAKMSTNMEPGDFDMRTAQRRSLVGGDSELVRLLAESRQMRRSTQRLLGGLQLESVDGQADGSNSKAPSDSSVLTVLVEEAQAAQAEMHRSSKHEAAADYVAALMKKTLARVEDPETDV